MKVQYDEKWIPLHISSLPHMLLLQGARHSSEKDFALNELEPKIPHRMLSDKIVRRTTVNKGLK